MNKIQILKYMTTPSKEKDDNNEICIMPFSIPLSFDDFDVNIIDLQNNNIWTTHDRNFEKLDITNDFISISTIIKNSKNKRNIIILPDNTDFVFKRETTYDVYLTKVKMKDLLPELTTKILPTLIPYKNEKNYLLFENTQTKIENFKYFSAFHFIKENSTSLTTSTSGKITTTQYNDIILTTLDITQDNEHLVTFLKHIKLINDKEEYPEWLKNYDMFNDKDLKENLNKLNIEIEQKQKEKAFCLQQIEKNNDYKSVLIETGSVLVERVFDILEQILDCDLSNFTDEKKEDFLIQKGNIVFIGEIKGVSSNVKNSHISQIRTRYDEFSEKNEIDKKNLKPILIINHQRNIPLIEREKVHKEQVEHAERNNCLIIETITLLKLYELFKNNKISSKEYKKIFFTNNGLLDINSIL